MDSSTPSPRPQAASHSRPSFSPSSGLSAVRLDPPPFEGVNNKWLPSSARRCQLAGLSPEQAVAAIHAAAAGRLRPGRALIPGEVERAIATAYSTPHAPGISAPKIAALSDAKIAEHLASEGLPPRFTDADALAFCASSPVPSPGALPTAEVLAMMFPPDVPLVLQTAAKAKAELCRVADLQWFFSRARASYQFLAANPTTGRMGSTQSGNRSFRAKGCFETRRFVVIEFDHAHPAEQFARIAFLQRIAADAAPLVMMLRSGNRSFHSWFFAQTADAATQLQTSGIKLGADPAAMQLHQLVRTPNQIRDNGRLQEVLWLSPLTLTNPPILSC